MSKQPADTFNTKVQLTFIAIVQGVIRLNHNRSQMMVRVKGNHIQLVLKDAYYYIMMKDDVNNAGNVLYGIGVFYRW
jgi:hypothetical protein